MLLTLLLVPATVEVLPERVNVPVPLVAMAMLPLLPTDIPVGLPVNVTA